MSNAPQHFILGTPQHHDDPDAPWSLTCPADCAVEMFGETPAAAADNLAYHLGAAHPAYFAAVTLAGAVAFELYAQLDDLSDDVASIVNNAVTTGLRPDMGDLAADLRDCIVAAIDQRVADWVADNAPTD